MMIAATSLALQQDMVHELWLCALLRPSLSWQMKGLAGNAVRTEIVIVAREDSRRAWWGLPQRGGELGRFAVTFPPFHFWGKRGRGMCSEANIYALTQTMSPPRISHESIGIRDGVNRTLDQSAHLYPVSDLSCLWLQACPVVVVSSPRRRLDILSVSRASCAKMQPKELTTAPGQSPEMRGRTEHAGVLLILLRPFCVGTQVPMYQLPCRTVDHPCGARTSTSCIATQGSTRHDRCRQPRVSNSAFWRRSGCSSARGRR